MLSDDTIRIKIPAVGSPAPRFDNLDFFAFPMIDLPFARDSPVHNTFEISDIPHVINSRSMGYMSLTTNGKTGVERVTPRSVVLVAAMIIVVLVIPALLGRSSTVKEFDRSPIDDLNIANPEIIFLGNSLLYSRIDPEYISE